jgi:hypothetical protein
MGEESVKAIADATKATAELGSKAIDAGMSVGSILKGTATEIAGAWEDSAKAWRYLRRVRLVKRTQEFLLEEGVISVPAGLPPSFLLPLLEKGEVQENDDLQDVYARLLANAVSPNCRAEPRAAYVEVVSQMTPLDAENLQILAQTQMKHKEGALPPLLSTYNLPSASESFDEPRDYEHVLESNIAISVSNLARLGLIEPSAATFGGQPIYLYVSVTPLGMDFYRACSRVGRHTPQAEDSITGAAART